MYTSNWVVSFVESDWNIVEKSRRDIWVRNTPIPNKWSFSLWNFIDIAFNWIGLPMNISSLFSHFRQFHVSVTHAATLVHSSIPAYIAYSLVAKANTLSIIWSQSDTILHSSYHLAWFIVTHAEISSMIQNAMKWLRNIWEKRLGKQLKLSFSDSKSGTDYVLFFWFNSSIASHCKKGVWIRASHGDHGLQLIIVLTHYYNIHDGGMSAH